MAAPKKRPGKGVGIRRIDCKVQNSVDCGGESGENGENVEENECGVCGERGKRERGTVEEDGYSRTESLDFDSSPAPHAYAALLSSTHSMHSLASINALNCA